MLLKATADRRMIQSVRAMFEAEQRAEKGIVPKLRGGQQAQVSGLALSSAYTFPEGDPANTEVRNSTEVMNHKNLKASI